MGAIIIYNIYIAHSYINKINVLDIETYEENQKVIPYCISYIIDNNLNTNYRNDRYEDLILKTITEISKKSYNIKIVIFVHNINFDGMLILESLTKNNIKFEWITKNLNIYMIKFEFMGCSYEFRCSYKLIPISLKNLSSYDKINSKQIFPYKFSNFNNLNYIGITPSIEYYENITKNEYEFINNKNLLFDFKKKSIEYCENDVIITHKMIYNIYEIIKKNNEHFFWNSYSASSLSNKIFFKIFNNKKINKNLIKQDANYIKKGYYGGRCEVFGNINQNEIIKYYDFSGMYGQCMLEKFPTGDGKFLANNLNINNIGFHTIKYESNIWLPVLPYHSITKKLLFPNGIMEGTYWYEEINLFIKKGGKILDHYFSYTYDNEGYVFNEYVEHFNNVKKNGGYYKIFGKLMINGLYGSFALKEDNYFTIATFSEQEFQSILCKTNVLNWAKTNECYIINIIKDYLSKEYYNKKNNKWSEKTTLRNVTYSAIIASKARIKLYNSMDQVINDGGKLLYCDTDSIFAGYNINNKKKKCYNFEWLDVYEDGVFISPKFYGYKKNNEPYVKIKGVKTENNKYDIIKKMFYEEKKTCEFNDQLTFKKKDFELKQNYITKVINLNSYDKRLFSEDKKNTFPIDWDPTL